MTSVPHAIVCRHGSTDWLANDIPDTASQAERDDRSVQRNLSDLGRAQAGAIRGTLDHLGVKVGPVLSTFYFRTREFAEIATGRKADPKEELLGIKHASIAPWWSVVAGSKGLTTLFVSAHGQPAGAMKIRLGEGDCAVVRIESETRLSVLGVITPSEWRQLLVP
jgi:phosphohistidine phosphatase SixA